MEVNKMGEIIDDKYDWSVKITLTLIVFFIILIIIKS